ncbi:MAG: 16S rRNA (guanine(966)-N(2))-methyltransferase RsmD [Lachnospiraceae bacterium]
MRIISGSRRSLRLKSLDGKHTRPTTDRIKETLFNMIQNDLHDSIFLDLFSGTGQIGLEAISRGASACVFVDNNRQCAACIKENIEHTKAEKESTLLQMDALPALRSLEGKIRFDLIFMDPPYNMELEKEILEYLSESKLADKNTILIVEADTGTDFSYIESLNYHILKEKVYKTNKHIFLSKNAE